MSSLVIPTEMPIIYICIG